MIISPQWVDGLPFEPTVAAPELGFTVTLPNRDWLAKRSYVNSKLMSFDLVNPHHDAVVKLMDRRVGEKAAGGPRAEAERLRRVYSEFGVELTEVSASQDGRTATFSYEMREGLSRLSKRVIVVAPAGADETVLVFRGEWPPESDPVMTPDMQAIVETAKIIE
jgi:hypothetical protein